MKRMARIFLVCLVGFFLLSIHADAQGGRKKKRKAPPKRVNTANMNKGQLPSDSTTQVLNAADTTATLPVPVVLPSLRNNSAVERNLIKDKTPLPYEHIREDDQVYKQVIWRNIETKEKMNLPFGYDADEDNGNQRFIYILLNAINSGELTAFSGINDRFTTPMKTSDIANLMVGSSYTVQVPDWLKDPTGATLHDTTIRDEFNPESIETYQIKEEVIFDKESSRLHFRILGIAPMVTRKDEMGNVKGQIALFWLYYPDIRSLLAKYECYNPRNYANKMSWEEVFESRYFSSYITKTTLNNPLNRSIAGYISDPLLRLVEGENVKEAIFNFEQNLWSY